MTSHVHVAVHVAILTSLFTVRGGLRSIHGQRNPHPKRGEVGTDNGAMALRCCVALACVCDLHSSSSKDMSFHRFPVDQVAGIEWIFKSRRGIPLL